MVDFERSRFDLVALPRAKAESIMFVEYRPEITRGQLFIIKVSAKNVRAIYGGR
jgi:hypothetical protein